MAATYTLQDPQCAPLILIHMQMAGYTGARRRGIEDWRLLDHVFPFSPSLPIWFSLFRIHTSTFLPPFPSISLSLFLSFSLSLSRFFFLSLFLCNRPSSFSFPLSPFLYFSSSIVSHSSLVFPLCTECPLGQSESRVPPWTQRIHAFCGCNFPRNSDDSICTHSHPCSA